MATSLREILLRNALIALLAVAATAAIASPLEESRATGPFFIQGKDSAGTEHRGVMDSLQNVYQRLSKQLGVTVDGRIQVKFHESVAKYVAEAAPGRLLAPVIFAGGILHIGPLATELSPALLNQAFAYQISYVLLDKAAANACPAWLIESFAVYASGKTENQSPPAAIQLASFSDLNQDLQQYTDPPERDDIEFILARTTRFFVQRYGEKKAFGVYREFDGNSPINKVFKKVYGEEMPAIEKAWAGYIRRFSAVKRLTR